MELYFYFGNNMKYLKQLPHLIVAMFQIVVNILKDKRFYFVLIFIVWSYIVAWTFNHYYVRSPIVLKIRSMFVRITPKIAPQKQIMGISMPVEKPLWEDEEFVMNIYELTRYYESHLGQDKSDMTATHIYCSTNGKINEIGYFPDGNRKFCFESYYDQYDTFKKWFIKNMKSGLTINETICKYVTGTVQPQCKRTQNMGL